MITEGTCSCEDDAIERPFQYIIHLWLVAVALVSRMVAPFKALVIMEKDASVRLVLLVGTTGKFNSIKNDPSFP